MTGAPMAAGRLGGRRRPQGGENLLQEQHVAAPGQDVALDPQMADALHADEALEAYGRHRLGELGPARGRGCQAEGSVRGRPLLDGDALTDANRDRLRAAQHREGKRGQPGAPLQRRVALERRGKR